MKTLQKISGILSGQTALFVILAAGIAFLQPSLFFWVKGDTQTAILGFIMLTMGMTLSTKDFQILAKHPADIFIGACAQYTLMPLLAFALVHIFNLPKGIAVGLLLVGTCPGGVSSNIMSYLAKGDVALSVGMTTASTLLAPVMTPLLMLWLSGEIVEVDAAGMFKSILIVTILPVMGGALMNFFFGKNQSYLKAMKIMPFEHPINPQGHGAKAGMPQAGLPDESVQKGGLPHLFFSGEEEIFRHAQTSSGSCNPIPESTARRLSCCSGVKGTALPPSEMVSPWGAGASKS